MKKIDKKDRKILCQLDMSARMPINELAKKVQEMLVELKD